MLILEIFQAIFTFTIGTAAYVLILLLIIFPILRSGPRYPDVSDDSD